MKSDESPVPHQWVDDDYRIGDSVPVYTSTIFARKTAPFLSPSDLSYVEQSVAYTFLCGIYDHRLELFYQEYPIQIRHKVPTGFKIHYALGRNQSDVLTVGLINTGPINGRFRRRLAAISDDASYLVGRFVDGVFNISGR